MIVMCTSYSVFSKVILQINDKDYAVGLSQTSTVLCSFCMHHIILMICWILFLLHLSEFTRAFQHAADRIQARAKFDHFDGSGEYMSEATCLIQFSICYYSNME